MAFLPIVLLAAGTAVKMASQYQEAKAAEETSKYNASVAKAQADQYRKVGEFEQARLLEAGALDVDKLARQKRQMAGTQRALYAKAGLLIEGSPLEVMADTASQFELDMAVSRYGTKSEIALSKYKTEVAAKRYTYESSYQKWKGKQYKKAGYAKMTSTFLTAASGASSSMPSSGTASTASTASVNKLDLAPGYGRRSL